MAELQQAKEALIESNRFLEVKVAERTQDLEKLASRDSLTNLLNRREITRILDIEIDRAHRQKFPLSVLMLDLDHFKNINDNFGHQTGDGVLILTAECLLESTRKTDFVGRIGGEEFLVLLPNTGYDTAARLAERCRLKIESTALGNVEFTSSIGVAELQLGEELDSLMQRADQALYLAKSSGRNAVR